MPPSSNPALSHCRKFILLYVGFQLLRYCRIVRGAIMPSIFAVVVIDTPGYYGNVLIQSALRADLVVLPCKVHTFDASQVVRTLRNLEQHAGELSLPMSQHRVLFNEYDSLDRNTRPLREVLA